MSSSFIDYKFFSILTSVSHGLSAIAELLICFTVIPAPHSRPSRLTVILILNWITMTLKLLLVFRLNFCCKVMNMILVTHYNSMTYIIGIGCRCACEQRRTTSLKRMNREVMVLQWAIVCYWNTIFTMWAKKPDCFWKCITLRSLTRERCVICQSCRILSRESMKLACQCN